MKKILSLILGLLWVLPVWGADCITDSDNIFLSDGATVGFYSQNGSYTDQHANMMTTDFLNIPDSAVTLKYSFDGESMSAPCIVFFDNAQQPIYFYPMRAQSTVSITIPDETKYVKIPYRTTFTTQTVTYTYDGCLDMPIKIATTKYNESAFSPLNTALQNAISVVDTVVSNTITQAGRIATLQAQKQTRPNDIADDSEKCPAGKKCLLVEDASGVPHWYEIVTGRLPDGYTELEYIESTGTQYIDTGIKPNDVDYIIADFQYTNTELISSAIIAAASSSIYNYFGEHTAFSGFGENWGNSSTWKKFDIAHNTNRHIWKADLSNSSEGIVKFYLDENLVTTQTGAQISDANFTISSLGFASLRSTKGKYYSVKFEKNNALIRDFVPALNPDGKIGMYDLVGGRFYENKGTGEFIGGQPVFN